MNCMFFACIKSMWLIVVFLTIVYILYCFLLFLWSLIVYSLHYLRTTLSISIQVPQEAPLTPLYATLF
jgi:hypothetical protein